MKQPVDKHTYTYLIFMYIFTYISYVICFPANPLLLLLRGTKSAYFILCLFFYAPARAFAYIFMAHVSHHLLSAYLLSAHFASLSLK